MQASGPRRLVVNADDFGRSHSINEAVLRAHRDGILTTASLMVTGDAAAEAVAEARRHPRLGVGLHLTLVHGRAALAPDRIHGLTDHHGDFSNNAPLAGWKYWSRADLREPLRAEIAAQFERFRQTGLELDHVNGHLHLHLHPVVFDLLVENAAAWGIRRMRLTRDSFPMSCRYTRGNLGYRLSHAAIFGWLSRRAAPQFHRLGWRHTQKVYGLLADGQVDEACILQLLPHLPPGDSELYSHPSLDRFRHEFDALVSPQVKAKVAELGLQLIRYQDL
ncbi:MAG: hopanoid biosynthesis-associated protein HpnK [Verrucomicrobiales bacterium]|nr:hopanoid biosynthesis-associated protein HpnK [Verrucomicrobiales bacterium]